MLERTFPNTTITCDDSKDPDLVIMSMFQNMERRSFSCPYIAWSGEPMQVRHKSEYAPILELNTTTTSTHKHVWLPLIIAEVPHTERVNPKQPKKYCCAYAFRNHVPERVQFFNTMRSLEPTCYSFGSSCPTPDSPFALGISDRCHNKSAFEDFAYVVGMENSIVPGYITEKIANAYCTGSVPIYWGHDDTVNMFFNSESFINVRNFASPSMAAAYAYYVWKDPQKYQKYLDAPITVNNHLADYECVYTEYRPWQKLFVDTLRDEFPDLS
jgi:hypothetical protein